MDPTNPWAPVLAKLAQLGVTVAPEVKAKLDSVLEPLADKDANAIVTAVADHIDMHGMAGMMNGTLKNALVGSEPTIDSVLNANIEGGTDALVDLFKSVAGSAPASPA